MEVMLDVVDIIVVLGFMFVFCCWLVEVVGFWVAVAVMPVCQQSLTQTQNTTHSQSLSEVRGKGYSRSKLERGIVI